MKKTLLALMAILVVSSPALAATPLEQSCKVRDAMLADDRSTNLLPVLVDLFSWNPKMAPQTISGALAVLATFDYQRVDVFEGVTFGDFQQTQVIVGSLRTNSPIFIEMRYQLLNNKTRLTNVNFKDNLNKLYPNLVPGQNIPKLSCG